MKPVPKMPMPIVLLAIILIFRSFAPGSASGRSRCLLLYALFQLFCLPLFCYSVRLRLGRLQAEAGAAFYMPYSNCFVCHYFDIPFVCAWVGFRQKPVPPSICPIPIVLFAMMLYMPCFLLLDLDPLFFVGGSDYGVYDFLHLPSHLQIGDCAIWSIGWFVAMSDALLRTGDLAEQVSVLNDDKVVEAQAVPRRRTEARKVLVLGADHYLAKALQSLVLLTQKQAEVIHILHIQYQRALAAIDLQVDELVTAGCDTAHLPGAADAGAVEIVILNHRRGHVVTGDFALLAALAVFALFHFGLAVGDHLARQAEQRNQFAGDVVAEVVAGAGAGNLFVAVPVVREFGVCEVVFIEVAVE